MLLLQFTSQLLKEFFVISNPPLLMAFISAKDVLNSQLIVMPTGWVVLIIVAQQLGFASSLEII